MKRTALVLGLLVILLSGYAQEEKNGISISLKTGATFANMYGEDVESETFLNGDSPKNFYANHPASDALKAGGHVGLLLDYRFFKYFSLGLGASYIQKGARINITKHWNNTLQRYEEQTGGIYWNQNFLVYEVPLTIYVPLGKNDFYVQAGWFEGSLLSSEEKGEITIAGKKYNYVNERRANDSEFGYFLGAGYLYAVPSLKGKVFAELSWARSILKSPGSGMIPNPQYYYNQVFNISLGYRYTLHFGN